MYGGAKMIELHPITGAIRFVPSREKKWLYHEQ
jgi:hypothetical protein